MQHFSKLLIFIYTLLVAAGAWLTYLFAPISEDSQYPLLINLLGLFLDFIGVLLLSDQFLKIPERFRVVHELALGTVMGLPFMLSIGSINYSVVAILFDLPSSELWAKALGIITIYVGITLYGFESIADGFKMKFMGNIKTRISYYGWFMLLSGLMLQIYSSLMQLNIT